MKNEKNYTWVFLYIKYSKFWSVSLEHFVERKPLISEECSFLSDVEFILNLVFDSPCPFWNEIITTNNIWQIHSPNGRVLKPTQISKQVALIDLSLLKAASNDWLWTGSWLWSRQRRPQKGLRKRSNTSQVVVLLKLGIQIQNLKMEYFCTILYGVTKRLSHKC